MQTISKHAIENAAYVGQRQYLLEKDNDLTVTEALLYLKRQSSKLPILESNVSDWVHYHSLTPWSIFLLPRIYLKRSLIPEKPKSSPNFIRKTGKWLPIRMLFGK